MLLRGLAEAADLRLRVLVGEDALDRKVDGVFTTDLLDPRRYLTGGEIVLTGLMWRRAPADSESFVAAVTAAGAVALAAGDAALGSVPDDLVVACRRHGLPLFEVPVDVSFAAITEQVLAARLSLSAGPGPAVARLRALAGGRVPGGAGAAVGLAAVLDVAASEFGVAGWVVSATGRLVAGAPAAPGRPARTALAAAWLGAATPPVTVLADGVPYSLFGVTGEPAHRLAGWCVAVAGDQAGWDAGRRAIAAELAAAAAGYRARHEEARRAVRAAADDALARVLGRPAGGGPGDPEIAAALRRCGLAPGQPLVAVALTVAPAQPHAAPAERSPGAGAGEPAWPQVARVLLEEMLPAPVAGVSGCEAVALVTGGGVLDRIEAATRALAGAYGPVPAARTGPCPPWRAPSPRRRTRSALPSGSASSPARRGRRARRPRAARRATAQAASRPAGRLPGSAGRWPRHGRPGGSPHCSVAVSACWTRPGSGLWSCCSPPRRPRQGRPSGPACCPRCSTTTLPTAPNWPARCGYSWAVRAPGPRPPRRCSCMSTRSGTGCAGSRN